jgi:hypothetical protein
MVKYNIQRFYGTKIRKCPSLSLQVRVSFYKNGKETAYTVFDAHGVKDKNSWFDCTRILYTAYDDLNRLKAVSYCGIPG